MISRYVHHEGKYALLVQGSEFRIARYDEGLNPSEQWDKAFNLADVEDMKQYLSAAVTRQGIRGGTWGEDLNP